jgi:hypothetical protein
LCKKLLPSNLDLLSREDLTSQHKRIKDFLAKLERLDNVIITDLKATEDDDDVIEAAEILCDDYTDKL